MLETGSVIDGKYKILSEIGHGGMSNVYLASSEKTDRPWAVKEVRKSLNRDFNLLRQRLVMETDLLKKLNHPNLPSIVDVIDSDENFLIVMDYIEGSTLGKLLDEEGAQPQEKVADWALQLCDVLYYLHTRQVPVIYRDMKPSNIVLRPDGSVVLIDFGAAREFKEKNMSDTCCLGTNGYAAPEQFGGMGQTDARTDIYCLGTTMYHLLTGHNPSKPPYEIYPITKWNPGLSTGLERIVQKCTRRNPEERYQTVRELRYDLEHYTELETQTQRMYPCRVRQIGQAAVFSLICGAGGSMIAVCFKHMSDRFCFLFAILVVLLFLLGIIMDITKKWRIISEKYVTHIKMQQKTVWKPSGSGTKPNRPDSRNAEESAWETVLLDHMENEAAKIGEI